MKGSRRPLSSHPKARPPWHGEDDIVEDDPHFDPEDDLGHYPGDGRQVTADLWAAIWPESVDPEDS